MYFFAGALVTSNIRNLKFCDAKVKAMEILGKLAAHATSEIILDRIVPYVVSRVCTELPNSSYVLNTFCSFRSPC